MKKYHEFGVMNEDPHRQGALSSFNALLCGRTRGGDLFRMTPDDEMERYLFPEDFDYWMEAKAKAMASQNRALE